MIKLAKFFSIVIFAFLLFSFIGFIELINETHFNHNNKADAIIVVTGGHDRLYAAGLLLKSHNNLSLLVSGVNRYTSDLDIIKLLNINGDLVKQVYLGRSAVNTAGNAQETAAWVNMHGYKSIYIVTNNYHMPRSLLEMHIAMPQVTLVPVPVEDFINTTQIFFNLTLKKGFLLASEFVKYLRADLKFLWLGSPYIEPTHSPTDKPFAPSPSLKKQQTKKPDFAITQIKLPK